MPAVKKERPQFPDRELIPLAVRKQKDAIESRQAMKDYRQAQTDAADRMAVQRLMRLARNAQKESA